MFLSASLNGAMTEGDIRRKVVHARPDLQPRKPTWDLSGGETGKKQIKRQITWGEGRVPAGAGGRDQGTRVLISRRIRRILAGSNPCGGEPTSEQA